jgi:hypothetical protein
MKDRSLSLAEQQLRGLNALYRENLPTPYLMLLYSTLDVFAYIWGGGRDQGSGSRFRNFSDKYIIKCLEDVTAFDLWGARCAIIHTGSPDSTASKQGKARRLLYSWGDGRIALLREIIKKAPRPELHAAVALEALEQAVADGLKEFLQDLELNADLRAVCEPRLNEVYSTIDLKKLAKQG